MNYNNRKLENYNKILLINNNNNKFYPIKINKFKISKK